MQIRPRLEAVIEEMLDGHIMLDEALAEFEKLYIQKAFARNKKRISHTAEALGIHRNTISKRVNSYRAEERKYQLHRGNHKVRHKTQSL
jgi:DNA-binding NtrC family response regulator